MDTTLSLNCLFLYSSPPHQSRKWRNQHSGRQRELSKVTESGGAEPGLSEAGICLPPEPHSLCLQCHPLSTVLHPWSSNCYMHQVNQNPQVLEENLDVQPCASSRNQTQVVWLNSSCHFLRTSFHSCHALQVALCSAKRRGPLSFAENRTQKFRRQRKEHMASKWEGTRGSLA